MNQKLIGGFQIITSSALVDRIMFRTCRSRKKRIKKKWAKQTCNYRSQPKKDVLIRGNCIFCHPSIFELIKAELSK